MTDSKAPASRSTRPNIQLIAHEAGVAVSTVSRYLNNSSYVGNKTRLKIQSVIEKHNYRPSMMAQSLVLGHSKIIGVVAIGTDFQQDAMQGVLTAGKRHGMSVLLSYASQGTQHKYEAVDLLVSIQARGIIVMPEPDADSREFCEYLVSTMHSRNTPVILSGQREGGERLDCITYDDKAAGYTATKHVIDKGMERVACITGSLHGRVGQLRYEGYRQGLIDSNICFDPDLVYEGNFQKEGGYRGLHAFHQKGLLPRAVVCANDMTALGVYLAAEELGIEIPGDLAVIGCDNIETSKLVSPKLSTVNFNNLSNGESLVDLLLERIEHPNAPPKIVMLDPLLIERQSTQI